MTNIIELFEAKDLESIQNLAKSLKDINEYVYKIDGNSLNLLHFCAGVQDKHFRNKCLKFLLSLPNIDLNAMAKIDNIQGITSGHIAAQWAHVDTLKTLIEFGCDLFLCDSYGLNVYDYAIDSNDQECVELVDSAIKTYLRSESCSSLINKCQNKCQNKCSNNDDIDNNENSLKALTYSSVSDKTLANNNSFNKSKTCEDCEQTEIYFDQNSSICNQKQNDSSNVSQSTLVSNVSYSRAHSTDSCHTDITETYLYKDKDYDVCLIEERYQGSTSLNKLKQSDVISVSCVTEDNNDKDVNEVIRLMSDTQIYDELKAMGDSPGPIIKTTRNLYAKRLVLMKKGSYSPSKKVLPLPNHSEELNRLIENTFPFDEAIKLEQQLINLFEKSDSKKNYFTYILLDPNITDNLSSQANNQNIVVDSYSKVDMSLFLKFIKSIFYVGKGQGNRAYEHFYEALKLSNNPNQDLSEKIDRILKIWSTDKGVISLHCFPSICSDEALTREALMIEALMLTNLTNKVNGQYKCDFKWNDRKKRIIGSYLLYKAFLILLLNGERQIKRPQS